LKRNQSGQATKNERARVQSRQLAGFGFSAMAQRFAIPSRKEAVAYLRHGVVCTENLIRVDDVMESPKLAE
jgi:uncharacterized protein (DUF1810 family)